MVAPAVAAAGIGALADAVGLGLDYFASKEAAKKSWKQQKKILQNQIQWRVADAVKAGLHPLAALGVNPASGPGPASIGDIGGAMSSMGQNVGRAVEAYMTPADKHAARLALLAEERAGLENDLLRSQIAGSAKALLTQGATPGVASALPNPLPPGGLGMSGLVIFRQEMCNRVRLRRITRAICLVILSPGLL